VGFNWQWVVSGIPVVSEVDMQQAKYAD